MRDLIEVIPPLELPPCGPIELSERHALVMVIIYGSAAPLTATSIGRRLNLDPDEAAPMVTPALRKLLELGLITRCAGKNMRDVTYVSKTWELPDYRVVQRGRRATKGLEIKRTISHGVTVIDTGELTNGGRKVDSETNGPSPSILASGVPTHA